MAEEERRDLKLWSIYGHTLRIGPPPFKKDGCHRVLDSYLSNINRAHGLLDACVFAAYTAGTAEGYRACFFMKEFGTLCPTQQQVDDNTEKYVRELGDTFANESIEKTNQKTAHYAEQLDFYVSQFGGNAPVIFEEILKSIVIQNWTATEVMLGDLWEFALNEHPECLADLRDSSKPKNERDLERTVSISSLSKYGFNISGKMGTIFKEKINFQTLERIKAAYSSSFWKDGETIKNLVAQDSLKALSLLRNIIVHKGGVIDKTFSNESKKLDLLKEIRAPGEGKHIFLNGELVHNITEPSTNACLRLIQAVDQWLVDH